MRHLFRIVFIFLSVFCIAVSCSSVPRQDVRIVKPLIDVASLCTDKQILFARSRKLICLICKGFNPECFGTTSTTTTSTSSTTTSTTTPATTISSSTTTPATTTSSTTTPTTTSSTTSTTTTTAAPTPE